MMMSSDMRMGVPAAGPGHQPMGGPMQGGPMQGGGAMQQQMMQYGSPDPSQDPSPHGGGLPDMMQGQMQMQGGQMQMQGQQMSIQS